MIVGHLFLQVFTSMSFEKHIFISYSREDTKEMQKVRATLMQEGLKIWTDEGITPGMPSWKDAIQDAIENACCVVVILSPDAKRSRWVKSELDYAEIQDVRIFPVLISGDPRTSLPFSLISGHYADLRTDYKNGIRLLISSIKELLGFIQAVAQPLSNEISRLENKVDMVETERVIKVSTDIITVVLVDDIERARENIKKMLGFEQDMKVVGEAGTGREGVTLVKELKPNIVLMDINMPDMDGIQATAIVTQAVPNTAVIMMSVQTDPDYVRRSLVVGARSFLDKPVDMDLLYKTIRMVHKQNQYWLQK